MTDWKRRYLRLSAATVLGALVKAALYLGIVKLAVPLSPASLPVAQADALPARFSLPQLIHCFDWRCFGVAAGFPMLQRALWGRGGKP